MANIRDKTTSILAGNLNLSVSYLITTVKQSASKDPLYFGGTGSKTLCVFLVTFDTALHIAKILLYREGGGILCYVCYILHNNHVLGNALLHVRKHQQDAFINTSLLTFFCKILLARLNEIVTCKS